MNIIGIAPAVADGAGSRNLELAAWKMLRAGIPQQVVSGTLGMAEPEVAKLQSMILRGGRTATA